MPKKTPPPPRSPKAVIVTVHGTGDTADRDDGPKWFQIGSAFTSRLQSILAQRGLETEIRPVRWSGANSALEREAGAEKLEQELAKLTKEHASVHIIGHSHGGNVANDAVCRLRLPEAVRAAFAAHPIARFNPWRFFLPRAAESPASLITVGTPFFAAKLSNTESFNPAAAMALSGLGLLGFMLLALGLGVSVTDPDVFGKMPEWAMVLIWIALGVGLVLNALGAWHLYRFGHAEFTRQTRLNLTETLRRNAQAAETRVHAIWHENDEAIAFLQKVESLPIEPLGKGMMISRSRRPGIVNGIRFAIFVVLAFGVIGVILAGLNLIFTEVEKANVASETFWFIVGALAVGAGCAPLLFGLSYFLNRFVFGVAPEALRPHINRFISGTFTGMAFGRDGPEAIGKVASRSHILETDEVVLSGEVADRMRQNAGVAASKLIEKYRWALFTVGGDTNASLTSMASDAMTWDSLIHTTYFDQPEVAEMIGAHIADRHAAEVAARR